MDKLVKKLKDDGNAPLASMYGDRDLGNKITKMWENNLHAIWYDMSGNSKHAKVKSLIEDASAWTEISKNLLVFQLNNMKISEELLKLHLILHIRDYNVRWFGPWPALKTFKKAQEDKEITADLSMYDYSS